MGRVCMEGREREGGSWVKYVEGEFGGMGWDGMGGKGRYG